MRQCKAVGTVPVTSVGAQEMSLTFSSQGPPALPEGISGAYSAVSPQARPPGKSPSVGPYPHNVTVPRGHPLSSPNTKEAKAHAVGTQRAVYFSNRRNHFTFLWCNHLLSQGVL